MNNTEQERQDEKHRAKEEAEKTGREIANWARFNFRIIVQLLIWLILMAFSGTSYFYLAQARREYDDLADKIKKFEAEGESIKEEIENLKIDSRIIENVLQGWKAEAKAANDVRMEQKLDKALERLQNTKR